MSGDIEIGRSGIDGSEIFRIEYNAGQNLLRAVCRGFWTPDDTTPYVRALARYIRLSHQRHDVARFLIDRRECPVQVAEVVSRIREVAVEIFRDNDRRALVVRSTLVQMQVQRILERGKSKVFGDMATATAWLLADE